eukprot:CAMPEP_0202830490 /NCGR_PEP_ID=MMETSP1389-20130828/16199_1 /ASSEMBLY_ACC=CAM_ASM_000865 /TAXON_ID=302021 /ORGANISM="Rhodomonas sp., Strain CCMP768" /LENGTH=168 /DNA_ID=CAMNT_0049504141 /DNA_START=134 /DNA_END=640 /DNA_ORIENTATION=-
MMARSGEGRSVSDAVELGDDADADGLVEGAEDTEALLVGVPVEAVDGLRREGPRVQQLHCPHHALLHPLRVLDHALRRVRVLVQVDGAVSAAGHEDLSVLGEVLCHPHRRLVRLLRQRLEPVLWVVCAEVEELELGLEGGGDQLVHLDVLAVKVQPADPVLRVALPPD